MADLEGEDIWGGEGEGVDAEVLQMGNEELRQRMRLMDNACAYMLACCGRCDAHGSRRSHRLLSNHARRMFCCRSRSDSVKHITTTDILRTWVARCISITIAEIRIMRSDLDRIRHETNSQREKIKDNTEKIKLNKQLPWLVGNVIEVLALTDEPEEEEDGAAMDTDAVRGGKSCVMKTSTRQTIFLPIPGLVPVDELTPGDLVGTNKDSYLILEKLPAEYDNRCADYVCICSSHNALLRPVYANALLLPLLSVSVSRSKPVVCVSRDGVDAVAIGSLPLSTIAVSGLAQLQAQVMFFDSSCEYRGILYSYNPLLYDCSAIQHASLLCVLHAATTRTYAAYTKLHCCCAAAVDHRVKAMEVDEKPTEEYSDIGGLDKQIQELIEAVVLPMTHKEMFDNIGIRAPKGVLLYGPPGTGKTLLARACAKQTDAIFLKLAGPQLVQMFIGDGAKLVRDAFEVRTQHIADSLRRL
eukprot:9784-Heterococcus_DN1.PRE.3